MPDIIITCKESDNPPICAASLRFEWQICLQAIAAVIAAKGCNYIQPTLAQVSSAIVANNYNNKSLLPPAKASPIS